MSCGECWDSGWYQGPRLPIISLLWGDGRAERGLVLPGRRVGLDVMGGHLLGGQDPSFSIGTLRPGGEKSLWWVERPEHPATLLVLEARTSMQATDL